ncbi:MAG: thioredoxin domain-containing protein [Pseudomonadota bacterium]
MLSVRAAAVFGLVALLSSNLSGCRSPGERGTDPGAQMPTATDVRLQGVDTSALTPREKSEWSRLVTELLAPCPEHPVSVAQCVNESRACAACVPAARYLVEQVRRGAAPAQADAAYRARFSPEAVKNIDTSGSPEKGAKDARVTIVEWADFECPACNAARSVLDAVVARYPGEVKLVFKHFPLSNHPHAEKAARAAAAAQEQGKFWEMHAALFDNQEKLDDALIERLAGDIGLDVARFRKDRDSEAIADRVARDRKQGEAVNLTSTPSIFINGRHFPPTSEFADDLDQWVRLEIELRGGRVSPAPAAKPEAPKHEEKTAPDSSAPAPGVSASAASARVP